MSKFIELELDDKALRMTVNCDHIISVHESESASQKGVCNIFMAGGPDGGRWFRIKEEYEVLRGKLTD